MTSSSNSEPVLSSRTSFLKGVPQFAELGEDDLRRLADNLSVRRCRAKEVIFHQGDPGNALFIIVKGRVRIFTVSRAGHEASIRILSMPEIFGEFAVLDGHPRSASAQAMEDCILLELDRNRFVKYIREMPDLALGLLRLLVQRLRWTTNFAVTIAQYDTAGRLLHILLYYKAMFGKAVEGEQYELDLGMNQADLASLVGVRREWINRILRDWSRRGLIEYDRGKITILDLSAVEQERDRSMEDLGAQEGW